MALGSHGTCIRTRICVPWGSQKQARVQSGPPCPEMYKGVHRKLLPCPQKIIRDSQRKAPAAPPAPSPPTLSRSRAPPQPPHPAAQDLPRPAAAPSWRTCRLIRPPQSNCAPADGHQKLSHWRTERHRTDMCSFVHLPRVNNTPHFPCSISPIQAPTCNIAAQFPNAGSCGTRAQVIGTQLLPEAVTSEES